jgi:hypothetical protein
MDCLLKAGTASLLLSFDDHDQINGELLPFQQV